MSLRRCTVTHEAALCCATQALSTERQEVMGLLLGSWTRDPATGVAVEAQVRHVVALARTDRRKDRVEVGYEQLAAAEERASALTAATRVETRIIGWVHSHPHITVLPSHVDLRTQAQYQQMDPGFLGLIVAVFQDDAKNQLGRMELTAFQSVPPGSSTLIETIDADSGPEEEADEFCMALDKPLAPAPRRTLRSGAGASNQEAVLVADEDVLFDDGHGAAAAVPMAVAYESSAGASAGSWVRKGVPIRLVAATALASASSSGAGKEEEEAEGGQAPATATADAARCVVSLQEVLLAEERFFYEAAARTNMRNNAGGGDVHALYNAAVYAKAMASLMEESGLPLLNSLESLLLNLRRDRALWEAANAKLWARLPPGEEEGAAAAGAAPMETEAVGAGAGAAAAGGPTCRAAWLRQARQGMWMRVIDGVGNDAQGVLRVSMDRDYGPSAANACCCLGTWRLRLAPMGLEGGAAAAAAAGTGSAETTGRLVSIRSASHTHGPGAVSFAFAGAEEGQQQRHVVCVGQEGEGEAASTLWLTGIAPIVCPDVL